MSFVDGFSDGSKIDTVHSQNYILDARQLVCQSRSRGATYMQEQCFDLSAWNVHSGGTANVTAIEIGQGGTNNPAGAFAFQFSTGSMPNSLCAISRKLASLPASYGVFALFALPSVDGDTRDALNVVVQDSVENKAMSLLIYKDSILIGADDGSYKSLGTHSPKYSCEDWFENRSNFDGTNTVSMYQGTQLISSVTLRLPVGNPINGGLIYINQQSGCSPNQVSQIAGMNIGITQLPDDGLVQSTPYVVPFDSSAATILFKVEDDCACVGLGTDFTAALIINGTENQLSLTDLGSHGLGTIDYTKAVRYFLGSFSTPMSKDSTIAYKAHMLNGKMMAILDVSMELTSTY